MLSSFFIARYLTVSLRGPVLTLRRDAFRRVIEHIEEISCCLGIPFIFGIIDFREGRF